VGVARTSLDPEIYHLRWNRFDYLPLFKKGSQAHLSTRLAHWRDQRKTNESVTFLLFLRAHPKDSLMAKNGDISSSTP